MKLKHSCWSTFEESWVVGPGNMPETSSMPSCQGRETVLSALTEACGVNAAKWSKNSKKWLVVEPKIYSRQNWPWVFLVTGGVPSTGPERTTGSDQQAHWRKGLCLLYPLPRGPRELEGSDWGHSIARQRVSRVVGRVIPAISLAKSV